MPKKNKDDVPNPNSVTNRDIIQRLNFLYQASVYLNGIASQSIASRAPSTRANGEQERNKRRPRKMTTSDLSRNYITSMKIVGQKTTVKMLVFILSFSLETHRTMQ
jgi:ribonuclease P protein subunit RPR2